MDIWAQADFDKLGSFGRNHFAAWVQDGLLKWDDPKQTYLAFAPVQDRFSVKEPIEFQLVEMAKRMPEHMRRAFVEGVNLTLIDMLLTDRSAVFEPLVEMKRVLGAPFNLITIRDNPAALQQFGWKSPYPSYVTAAPSLWYQWRRHYTS